MRPRPARIPIPRLPTRRAVLAGLAALACGLLVLRLTLGADAARARFGALAPVWVAAHDLAAGTEIGASDVRVEQRPVALAPESRVRTDPRGLTVRAPVLAGEVLVAPRLVGGASGPGALVPEGWRAVAVPAGDADLPLRIGDLVDVIAVVEAGTGWSGRVLAHDAVTVDVADDGSRTVAVPAAAVPRIASAMVAGVVTLALVP